jgi:hypothetical protein
MLNKRACQTPSSNPIDKQASNQIKQASNAETGSCKCDSIGERHSTQASGTMRNKRSCKLQEARDRCCCCVLLEEWGPLAQPHAFSFIHYIHTTFIHSLHAHHMHACMLGGHGKPDIPPPPFCCPSLSCMCMRTFESISR